MADIQHSVLTDPELHEPKGISDADENSVYTADGAGSGAWSVPPYNNPVFVEIDRPAASISLTSATDVLIGSFAFDDANLGKFSLITNSRLTVLESGLYSVNMSVQIIPGTALGATNEVVTANLKINGATPPASRSIPITVIRNSANTDPFVVHINRIIDISANDYFELYLNNAAATRSYTVSAGINMFKFGNL